MQLKLYGPRLKLMKESDGSSFVLLLDDFDEKTKKSKIVTVEVPREQLQEWTEVFTKALRGEN